MSPSELLLRQKANLFLDIMLFQLMIFLLGFFVATVYKKVSKKDVSENYYTILFFVGTVLYFFFN